MKQLLKLLTVVSFLVPTASYASETALPTGYTKNSDYAIRYDDWNFVLSASVLDTGPSDRKPAGRSGAKVTSSRIKHGNLSPTAFEGNRVIFHVFKQAHIDNLIAIRQDFEDVPNHLPLEEFSKNEQLAYWLNLHNVAVMIEVAKEYPIKKLQKLRQGKKSAWKRKTMTVAGVPVSITDIEQHIVSNWNDPLVLYGLFMGSIGGPNIRVEAYTGDNVVEALQRNAVEFVNSLRGFRVWSKQGRVSEHYALGERYFPDFEKDIKAHLLAYARPDTRRDLNKVKSFKMKNYDWGIADLKNGDTYKGSSFNTSPNALVHFVGSPNPEGMTFFTKNEYVAEVGSFDSAISRGTFNDAGSVATLSPQTRALLRAMKIRKERRMKQGQVSVEEFVDGTGGRVAKKKKDTQLE